MIVLDKRMAFISRYLAEKEYFIPDNVRAALSYIYYLIHKKGKDKALAIHMANEKYKKLFKVDYTKDYLRKMYNTRLAYIKNSEDKYIEWCREMRERQYGVQPKLCECGCGQEVKKNNRFVHGHNINNRSKEEKQHYAKVMINKRSKKHEIKKVIKVDFKKSA